MDFAGLVLHLGVDEHADQVVPSLEAAGLDDRLHDVDERAQTETVRRDGGADVEGQGQRYAEAPGDGEQRDGGAELDVQVGPAVVLERVDEGVHGAVDPLLNPPPGLFGDERWLHQGPVAPVPRAVHVEDHRLLERRLAARGVLGGRVGGAVAHHGIAGGVVEHREVRTVRKRQPLEKRIPVEPDEGADDAQDAPGRFHAGGGRRGRCRPRRRRLWVA